MKQHKWHKEIKHWADGGEIEISYYKEHGKDVWLDTDEPLWALSDNYKYRIKLQPKEPQYLYAWLNKDDDTVALEAFHPNGILEDKLFKYIGKVPLITEAE